MMFDTSTIPEDAFNVTPSDTAKIQAFGFMSCDGGVVVVQTAKGGGNVTFTLTPGNQVWLGISRIMATGTTSKQIVAFGPQ